MNEDEIGSPLATDACAGMSRRRFLKLAGAGTGLAAGAGALGPMMDQLRAFAAPPVGPTEGILVLLMLDGGNDGLNTVVPYATDAYYDKRTHIAIPPEQLHNGSGQGFR